MKEVINIKKVNAPKHVGLIPDGNRRFAKRLMLRPWKGHEWGIEKIRSVFDWSKEAGVKIITFYALSVENLEKRPKREINLLFGLAKDEINDVLNKKDSFVHKNKVRIKFFGKIELLPEDLRKNMEKLEKATHGYSDYYINIAIAYGGRQEIVDTCKKIGSKIVKGEIKPEDVNEDVIRQNLYTNGMPDPDLIIRTSEKRLSGFLLWQSAYSEISFIDTYWPELTKKQFMTAINDFGKRERRLGK